MHSREVANTNLIVFGLTQPALELKIYYTRGKQANHYIADEVHIPDITPEIHSMASENII